MNIEILPFNEEHISKAGELLANRQRRSRETTPDLPPAFEDPQAAARSVRVALEKPGASGFAAVDGDRLLGYLVGELLIDQLWGRTAWVKTAGCAYDTEAGVEVVRELYARLGEQWVSRGCYFHFAMVPPADKVLVDAWFRLSFGLEQIHALLDLQEADLAPRSLLGDIEIRKGVPPDGEALKELALIISRHQASAPTWGITLPESEPDLLEGYAELVEEDDVTVWAAFRNGEILGMQAFWEAEAGPENLHIPSQSIHLTAAAVKPGARGLGIASALARCGLSQALEEGFRYSETDWRSANLLASRTWPRLGYRPVMYRLVRRIDSRIAWANGRSTQP